MEPHSPRAKQELANTCSERCDNHRCQESLSHRTPLQNTVTDSIQTVRPLAIAAIERGAPEERLTLVHRLAAANEENSETGKWNIEEIISECGAEL